LHYFICVKQIIFDIIIVDDYHFNKSR